MYRWLHTHPILGAVILLFVSAGIIAVVSNQNRTPNWVTATVERGPVTQIVSVSGTVEATQSANLSFPTTGVVSDILVSRGQSVEAGELLATIGDASVVAERQQASAALAESLALRQELQAGETAEAQAVTETTVANARAALERTQRLAIEQVENARAALYSNDLMALANDPDTSAAAPVVTGTYNCTLDGTYTLELYRSSTDSGFSYRLNGLEGGTFSASVDQPAPIGDCGLYIQFTEGDDYADSTWEIAVPNPRSSTYVTRQNAYLLALTQAEQNVDAARDAVRLAENEATRSNAGARVEALIAANARVQQAQASIQQVDARLSEYAIFAPFAGVVTDVHVDIGEVIRSQDALSLLNTDNFELVARVPEIDVTRLAVGQPVTALFDAKRDETVNGTISFVSPQATEIDGVGYFEAIITLTNTPEWMRAGLNADIDISLATVSDTLRLPQRFIEYTATGTNVRIPVRNTATHQPITIGLTGNDGYVEVTDLAEGTTVIAP